MEMEAEHSVDILSQMNITYGSRSVAINAGRHMAYNERSL
jgi:hypothetical protein